MTLVWRPGFQQWDPSLISTALWLDAADASTVTTVSGAVSQWNDKSGNNRHCAQSSASLRPVYASNAINGRNSIEFSVGSAAGHYLDGLSASPLSLVNRTIFTVAEETNHVDFAGIFILPPTSGSDFEQTTAVVHAAGAAGSAYEVDFAGSTSTSYQVRLSPFQTMRRLICAEVKQAGLGSLFVNGTSTATDNSFTEFSSTSARGYLLGARYLSGAIDAAYRLRGRISEIIYLESTANQATRQNVEGYLAHKWGLTANLPNNHPYRWTPPTPGA